MVMSRFPVSICRILAGVAAVGLLVPTAGTAIAQEVYGASGQEIRQIRITGTQRIEPSTVLNYLDVRVGDHMNQGTLDRALKSLFATSLFADVVLRQQGNTLEVNVTENPVINQIAFEGNDKIDDDQLRAEVQLKPRQVFTRSKVQADVNRLYQIYQRNGRFSVKIEPKIINLDQNRVNLVFEIEEGEVTKVESIKFVGNTHFDDDELRAVLSTREARWYKFLTTNDRYDPDRLAYDQELLRRFYLAKGYADFRVVSANAELSRTRDDFYVTITVEEGERYKVGDLAIHSQIRNFDASPLANDLTLKTGDWYNADQVQKSIDKMTASLGDRQYAFVAIKPNISRKRDGHTIDISFDIQETPRVFVERIDVNGNVRTLDKVIRREVTVAEGDPFSKTKVAKSEQNIKDLGFFEKVEVKPKQGSAPDKTVLDVNVSEQSTGELSLGAGFSTSDGPLGDIRIRERNFLGRGQDVLLATTIAGERSEVDFSFTEPYFLDRDLSAGFDLFHITRDLQDESSFDQRQTGGGLNMGYPLSEKWRQTLRYRIEQNEITDVDEDASRYIRDQEGERLTSAVSQRLTYDNRDSVLFPTSGLYSWLDTELAGVGGDAKYVLGKLGSTYYYPVTEKVIFSLLGETGAMTGYGGEDVRINERFFIGGTSLRGFERSGIGPRDLDTDDALGGNYFYRGSAEFSFPIGLPEDLGVLGHSFTDFGSLFGLDKNVSGGNVVDDNALRATAGLGLSWRSPLGPIRIDTAYPLLDEEYDQREAFRFSFGTRF